MLHLDTTVPTLEDLRTQRERALALGARLLFDRSDDEQEPLYVYADPQGILFASSWLRNWVRRGVLDSWERLRSVVPAHLVGEAIHG